MADPLERAIATASADIVDAMGSHAAPEKRRAMRDFMELAIWSASSFADGLSSSAWIDKNKDDGWLRGAAGERYELPDSLTDSQFRELAELLSLGKDSIEKSLPARLKMEPELEAEVSRIVGKPMTKPPLPDSERPPLASPEVVPPKPEPKLKPEQAEDIALPPKRSPEMKRDDVRAPDDEFDDSIEDKPGLPGDPRLKK